MNRTPAQNTRFHGLVKTLKLNPDEKKEIVLQVSDGRTNSSADLTASEMAQAINILSGKDNSRIYRMQAKARAIAQDIGILKVVGSKTDYSALNAFILSKFKKATLFDLDFDQLRNCITGLERWRDGRTKNELKPYLTA